MAHPYPRLSLFTLTAGLLAATAFGQPGTKDPTFVTGSGFEAVNVWDQEVSALVLQPDGKLLVGGAFNTYNGVARNRIARLEVNGALDTGFDPGSGINSGQPYWGATALALQPDGKVLVGGHFTTFNGTPKGALVRLNADGSLDPGFGTAAGFVGNSYVYALAVCADGKVLVAGQFQDYEGHACHNLIRLTAEGAFDPTFDPGTGPSEVIYTMALRADQRILIGGAFDHFNGVPVGFFAQLNADGSLDSGFNAGTGFNYRVWCIALRPDDTMLVGGEFTAVAGVPRQRIARLHPDGTLDTGFDPGPSTSTEVTALAVEPDGDVLAGGRFTDFGGVARSNIMRLTPDGAVDPLFDPGSGTDAGFPYRGVTALAVRPDGKVLAGGTFTHFNGSPENRIVQLFGDCVPGASCDDGDVLTGPDHFTADCTCTGPAIDCLGVPGGSALPGTACDDGDAATGNDTYNTACQCAGLPYDCLGIAGGAAVPGSPCDDGEQGTGNDTYQTDCVCAGALIDCAGVPGGTALPGSTCNDGSVLTGPDTWDNGCICTGPAIDCLGVPNGTTLPGSPCDDGLISTVDDLYGTDCVCAGTTICVPTQLTTAADPVVSCGAVNLKFDGSSIIAANEVPGANRYQFRFTNSAGQPAYSRNIAFPTRSFTLTKWYTNPLKAGRTYNVVVRASFDNGATWCDYGPSCTVRISWSPLAPGMVRDLEEAGASAPALLVYPNPANGEEVRIRMGGADPALTTATLDLTDLFGKRVMTATLPMQEGELNAMLPLSTDLADGVYLLTITSGKQVLNERVVITR